MSTKGEATRFWIEVAKGVRWLTRHLVNTLRMLWRDLLWFAAADPEYDQDDAIYRPTSSAKYVEIDKGSAIAEVDTVSETVLCRKCRTPISIKAKMCPHCQEGQSRWYTASKAVQALSSLATVIAILFLIQSNWQTKKALEYQADSNRIAKEYFAYYDVQIQLMKEANEIERNRDVFANERSKQEDLKYINDQRPSLSLSSPCRIKDNLMILGFDVLNNSKSSSIDGWMRIHYLNMEMKEFLDSSEIYLGLMMPNKKVSLIKEFELNTVPDTFIADVALTWKWDYNRQNYSDIRPRIVIIHPGRKTCSCYFIGNKDDLLKMAAEKGNK